MTKLTAKIGEAEAAVAKMRAQSKAAAKQLEKLSKDGVKTGGWACHAVVKSVCFGGRGRVSPRAGVVGKGSRRSSGTRLQGRRHDGWV